VTVQNSTKNCIKNNLPFTVFKIFYYIYYILSMVGDLYNTARFYGKIKVRGIIFLAISKVDNNYR